MVLEFLMEKLTKQRVYWFSDNQNVVRILQNGSKKQDPQTEALTSLSLRQQMWMDSLYTKPAGRLGELHCEPWWPGNPSKMIDDIWGPHTVDHFACSYNTQISPLNSWFWNPAVDAFTCDWSGEVNWMCPTPYLIPRTKRLLILQHWYTVGPQLALDPILAYVNHQHGNFVAEWKVLSKSELVIIPVQVYSMDHLHCNTNVLALK